MTNRYCEVLKIGVPELEAVVQHREANTFARLIVVLLERGAPTTLAEAATRLERAGVGTRDDVLAALRKCRPGRSPVYRDGDFYGLDPYADELDLWLFRLGLRPPKVAPLRVVRPDPEPLPGPEHSLSIAELEEAWREQSLAYWSTQRLALSVLDAHGGGPMTPDDVGAFVRDLSDWHVFRVEAGSGWRMGAIRVREDGRWEINPGHPALISARKAVRAQISTVRKWAGGRYDPVVVQAQRQVVAEKRAAHARELAKLRRVIVVSLPLKSARAVTVLDVSSREIMTFFDTEIDKARERMLEYDIIGGVQVREVVRRLGAAPEHLRLDELGPPQKTVTVNTRGRSIKITTEMLIQSSCGIRRPFGDPTKMANDLAKGDLKRLRARLEADAKSLFALFNYGRLHGGVRLRWGSVDRMFPAPWLHRDEESFYELIRRAFDSNLPMEVVSGSAPGWDEPWARSQLCHVMPDAPYRPVLVDEAGFVVDERDVQLARIVGES
ncbi:MAG: hypothetical protein AAF735_07630 [Myxococcota bacterium]